LSFTSSESETACSSACSSSLVDANGPAEPDSVLFCFFFCCCFFSLRPSLVSVSTSGGSSPVSGVDSFDSEWSARASHSS
jgi:hypothetical protein